MITTKKFFMLGIISFSIIGVCDIANLLIFFDNYTIFSIIAGSARILFDFATAGFFYYLLKTSVPEGDASFLDSSPQEIEAAFKESLQNGERKPSVHRKKKAN